MFYEIMHRESCVAQLSTTGECRVCLEDFMPYDLVLVGKVNNLMMFFIMENVNVVVNTNIGVLVYFI